jgi:hypothetical protein
MKNKSLFSILYSSVIWFIFCFIFQINSLDTIKNFFNKSIETAKDGYNWLTGNNKKIAKIYDNNSSINEKEIKITPLTDQTIPEIAPTNLNTENTDNNNTESLAEENTNKTKKNIDNTVQTDSTLFNKAQDNEKIINTYIEIITKNKPLQKEKKEELKNQIEKKIVENPKYLATIQSTVNKDRKDKIIKLKKTISGKIDKKIKENSEKNTAQSPISSEYSSSSPETNQKQENTKNNELIQGYTKKEIEQVNNLIVHTNSSKNNTQKINQNTSEDNEPYKEKYFRLIATMMKEYFKKDSHNNTKKEELAINNKNDTITSIKGK